ncbi:MAG: hypothetical protein K6G26_08735 [Lachnospiraceae bacterium]|nr:hypothetical protein [Lachnospiraceae bacterium]
MQLLYTIMVSAIHISITACFNEGNNNWDSNNGRNYKFGIGTYYYSNGNIVAE